MMSSISYVLLVFLVLISVEGCGGGAAAPQSENTTPSLAANPSQKAAMELALAQTLDKSRRSKAALEAYRRIVREYPESPQANIAGERLKALRSK